MAGSSSSSLERSTTSPFPYQRPSSPFSSSSSSSSFINNNRVMPLSGSSSSASYNGGGIVANNNSRSITPSLQQADSVYTNRSPVEFASDELLAEALDAPGSAGGDSISVTIRFRPLSEREYLKGDEIAWYADGDKIVRNEYNPATAYGFDKVFGPSTTTDDVYEVAARPVVKAAMEGVNGTVFAYGVTSSGKTHTMHGDQNSPGIIPLAIMDVFNLIQEASGREFLLRVSYLEIYNEVINDLLDPTGQNLRVREDAQGTYVEGIKEEVVLSPGHALSFIAAGEEHRHVGSNNFNLFSSRSHTIFSLMIESSAQGDEYDGVVFSQLNLIDLAGSESSKTETTGLRRKEGAYINKSLLTLGTVIGKLSEGRACHIPYRDSKLTRLLQSSLSGHGHVSLICTITPASSNMEETHNTLKFASRAKRVEIFASRNKIIDEKSLIKKYQREIAVLREELDQLKKGGLVGVDPEELMTLKQKLQEGQVKMQSRLEEEEEAKAALMSRIQRLTKLILVSTKNMIPGNSNNALGHQRSRSVGEDEKLDVLRDFSLLTESDGGSSAAPSDTSNGNTVTESNRGRTTTPDQMDLLVEQVKMLAGDIALSTSTLKRLVEQSVDEPESSKAQIQKLECEIQEKRRQLRFLEQRINESGEASTSKASLAEMQHTVTKLMTQCSETAFELEIQLADNRILQEQLHNKSTENKELLEKINLLEGQLASGNGHSINEDHLHELRKMIQYQEIENENLKIDYLKISEENSGLHVQNQKLSEEASYAKELASAAAVELKVLAGEVTKLSLQNAKLEKELLASREAAHLRGPALQMSNGGSKKYSDSMRPGRKGRLSGRSNEVSLTGSYDFESWDLGLDDMKMELQARKQREAALEAALSEKEFVEDEYRKKFEEAKKREAALENDLANMWVRVAQLKKEGAVTDLSTNESHANHANDLKKVDVNSKDGVVKERELVDVPKTIQDAPKEESLVLRLKARMQEMKENKLKNSVNGDANSHVCKVCFESPTAALLLPCRHFCLCKSCSLACSECPICRTKITDRIFAFPS